MLLALTVALLVGVALYARQLGRSQAQPGSVNAFGYVVVKYGVLVLLLVILGFFLLGCALPAASSGGGL